MVNTQKVKVVVLSTVAIKGSKGSSFVSRIGSILKVKLRVKFGSI